MLMPLQQLNNTLANARNSKVINNSLKKNTQVTQDIFLNSAVLVLVFCTMPRARPSLKEQFKSIPSA